MRRRSTACIIHLSIASLVFAACGGGSAELRSPAGVTVTPITMTSAFSEGGNLPIDYTCDGRDVLPSLAWSSPPEGTKSLAVMIDDPDAPGTTFTHFLAYGIGAQTHELRGGADPTPEGVRIGKNDFGAVRYNGPCPPKGEEHRYRFQIFALDVPVILEEAASRSDLESAMNGHVLGRGTLTANFGH